MSLSYAHCLFSANSIQLEDQQGRLEQEIRELLMKEGEWALNFWFFQPEPAVMNARNNSKQTETLVKSLLKPRQRYFLIPFTIRVNGYSQAFILA